MDEGLLQTMQQDPVLPELARQLLNGDLGGLCAGADEITLGLTKETIGFAADKPSRTPVFNRMPVKEPSKFISSRAFARVFKKVNAPALQELMIAGILELPPMYVGENGLGLIKRDICDWAFEYSRISA